MYVVQKIVNQWLSVINNKIVVETVTFLNYPLAETFMFSIKE